jgi:deoxyadenosine/deoxycytidine kinase|uniref:Deoxynucleoside kinase domain-containing protein n=1 Tax=viral metagenome TaxID=1070528 RepID=A0A6C0BQ52_9ZZZZ
MKFFVIEGNVGTGKTTFLKKMKERYDDIIIIEEPVDEWYNVKDEDDVSLFERFYTDPKNYGYLFQTNVLATRFKKILDTIRMYSSQNKIILCERSILTDKHIFVAAALELGSLNKMEAEVFNNLYNICLYSTHMKVDSIVYLQCDPTISYERLKKRNRKGEESVHFDYIKLLHEKHEDWLINKKSDIPIYVVDNTYEPDFVNIYSFLKKM